MAAGNKTQERENIEYKIISIKQRWVELGTSEKRNQQHQAELLLVRLFASSLGNSFVLRLVRMLFVSVCRSTNSSTC